MMAVVHTKDASGASSGKIVCDSCGAEQPPVAEVLAGHGLVNMGWRCSGGTHFCPSCVEAEATA